MIALRGFATAARSPAGIIIFHIRTDILLPMDRGGPSG